MSDDVLKLVDCEVLGQEVLFLLNVGQVGLFVLFRNHGDAVAVLLFDPVCLLNSLFCSQRERVCVCACVCVSEARETDRQTDRERQREKKKQTTEKMR